MKKIFILIGILFSLCGCSSNEKNLIHEHCSRVGTISLDGRAELNYELYYTGDVLIKLESYESVYSDDSIVLDTYQDAYQKIHDNYKDIKYYSTELKRDDKSVKSIMIIEYDKIDIDKLIEIEGVEDNIFDNKIPKASKWKEFAKKVGTSCSKVDN